MIYAIVAAFTQGSLVPSAKRCSSLALCLCACWAPQLLAQAPIPQEPICFPSDPLIVATPPELPAIDAALEDQDLVINADSFDSFKNNLDVSGNVEIQYRGGTIRAEQATLGNDELDLPGRMTYTTPDVVVFGDDGHVDQKAETIRLSRAGFDMPKRPAHASADEIVLTSNSRLSMANVLFTTCPADHPSWQLHARDIDIDVNGGVGTARGMKLDFKGVPILYAPYFTFPVGNQRKSGFLTPDIGERDRTGFDLTVPYYLNLAPNYDLSLEPRYMSKRGTQLRSELRYLLPNSKGQLGFEYLPDDNETGDDRRYVNFSHDSLFGDNWRVLAGVEQVSDATYFEDLGTSLAVTSQTHLDRFVDITYYAPSWSLLTRFQDYQTIDTTLTDEERPYERVPQMLFGGRWNGRLLGFDSTTELVNFERNVGVTGWRLDTTQELSLRFARSGMYLTPAVAVRQTNYWVDDPATGTESTPARGLAVESLDTGIKFERDAGRSGNWIQTLEPRALYVHVPLEAQDDLPVFDTITPDFNLVQLFRKYRFVGPDRIADTDQLSFGLTTRLIGAGDGRERLAATLGQTRYLKAQHVSLPGQPPIDERSSDYVAEMALGLAQTWNLDVGYQWNSDTDLTARAETRFEYRPKDDRLFGFGYRYRRELLEQGDIWVVWPVAEKWRVIGRYSYSLLEKEPLEQFAGWEYESCCWRFRMVGRRYVSRSTGDADSSISIQLELKGLSQGGRSPESLLDRGILGYRSIARTETSEP
ncbi:MAG TPA: LPS assembly protein LptD [Gammaproteobacteria bacterium]|nr:LPS assembly protein LptD [Gammaproteobacteria bacterium]